MNGDASAQCSLGNLYDDGSIGVEEELKDRPGVTANYHRKNHIEAVKWYRRAAAQGNAAAEFFLGLMYDNGQGVPQDYVEAYKWYNLAAAQGLAEEQGASPAITNRDAIARYMTPDQIAEAQQLSREFKPRKEFGSDNSSSPEEPTATGTGFFITDDGYLISNFLC
jgi:TPR repeat protein